MEMIRRSLCAKINRVGYFSPAHHRFKAPEILLVGIEVESLAYKEGLSLKLCHSLPSITLIVAKAIKGFFGLTKRVIHPYNKIINLIN